MLRSSRLPRSPHRAAPISRTCGSPRRWLRSGKGPRRSAFARVAAAKSCGGFATVWARVRPGSELRARMRGSAGQFLDTAAAVRAGRSVIIEDGSAGGATHGLAAADQIRQCGPFATVDGHQSIATTGAAPGAGTQGAVTRGLASGNLGGSQVDDHTVACGTRRVRGALARWHEVIKRIAERGGGRTARAIDRGAARAELHLECGIDRDEIRDRSGACTEATILRDHDALRVGRTRSDVEAAATAAARSSAARATATNSRACFTRAIAGGPLR